MGKSVCAEALGSETPNWKSYGVISSPIIVYYDLITARRPCSLRTATRDAIPTPGNYLAFFCLFGILRQSALMVRLASLFATAISPFASVVLLDTSTCYHIGHHIAPPPFAMAHYNPVAGLQRILAQITSTCDWVFRLGGPVLDPPGLFAFVVLSGMSRSILGVEWPRRWMPFKNSQQPFLHNFWIEPGSLSKRIATVARAQLALPP